MTLFLDNDALAKLASWDLLEEGIKACGFELADVRYLPTAPFWLRLSGKKKQDCKYSPEVQGRLRQVLAAGRASEDDCADDDATLPTVQDVDGGEAILLAQAARESGSVFCTGDKKCILAVASAPEFAELAASLKGRVICLEQVLLRAVEQLGFEEVKSRVVESNQLDIDTAVRAAFGSGLQATDFNACGSLEQRVKSLAEDAARMLAAQDYRFLDSGET